MEEIAGARGGVDRALERVGEGKILLSLMAVALFSHAYNMFGYPQYLGDEGIYMEQAWAVLRLGRLAPYTYFYDHAPAGWLLVALWTLLLPQGFLTFGMAINSGRVLMLLLHLASVFLLFRITRTLSGSITAAVVATLMFSLSPLSLYYQRMVLLDNIMVFWLLLSIDLLLEFRTRLLAVLGSGLCMGIALLTKENAVFFLPAVGYLMFRTVRTGHMERFARVGWVFTLVLIVSTYPLYALLKNELLPPEVSFLVNSTPAEHVSLIGTIGWQLQRSGGGILDPDSQFWQYFRAWWAKDSVILAVGAASTVINLAVAGLKRNGDYLVIALLALFFAIYLARGSVMLEFYVVPILPFLAMNFGLTASLLVRDLPAIAGLPLTALAMGLMIAAFVFTARDHYRVPLTTPQMEQLAWIQENVPSSSTLVVDDDLWVDLHEPADGKPVFARAYSHWKVAQDPAVQVQVLHNDWKEVDYLVMSPDLLLTFRGQQEKLPLEIYDHSKTVATFTEGKVQVEVRKVTQ